MAGITVMRGTSTVTDGQGLRCGWIRDNPAKTAPKGDHPVDSPRLHASVEDGDMCAYREMSRVSGPGRKVIRLAMTWWGISSARGCFVRAWG
jgi:hypothetical protein